MATSSRLATSRSSRNVPRPVTSRTSSLRRTAVPTHFSAGMPGCSLNGADDVDVARAHAQVPGQRFANFGVSRRGVLRQQLMTRDDHARRTEAALECERLTECGLQRAESAWRRQPFDSGYRRTIDLGGEEQTTARRPSVDEHCARAAHTVFAPDVGTRQADVVAQEVGQRAALLNLALDGLSVQDQSDVELHVAS